MDEPMTTSQSHPQNSPTSVEDYAPEGEDELESSDGELITLDFTRLRSYASIDDESITFFGKSSGKALIRAAVEMKKEFYKTDGPGASSTDEDTHPKDRSFSYRRPEFWRMELVNPCLCPINPHNTHPIR